MPVVLLRLTSYAPSEPGRPNHCPHCGGQILQRWGRVTRSISDMQSREAEIYRYRCYDCGRTFREYPRGVDRTGQSPRIRYLAALTWALGLSYRDASEFFGKKGIHLSHTTVWREGQELATRINGHKDYSSLRKYSLDPVYHKGISSKLGVVIAVDLGDGRPEIIGTVDEYNPRLVKSWLEPLVKDAGIEVIQLGTGYLHQD